MVFDPLTAASVLVLAAGSSSAARVDMDNLCVMPKAADIRVVPSTRAIRYDYSKSLAQMQGVGIDTIDPHSFGSGISMTQGYMKGAIKLAPQVQIATKTYPALQAGCVWYDKINIKIEIDPTIVIAKEVKADPCMSKAVADHEMKHIMVDRQVVNKYSRIIGEQVRAELKQRGFMAGPIPQNAMQSVANRMQKTVFQVVEHQYKKMELERLELQRAVDSAQEYERVRNLCPDFNPMKLQRERRRSN